MTRINRIKNYTIRGTIIVTKLSKKVQERRLQWYGHVLRIGEDYLGKRVMEMKVEGTRARGRPKQRWMENVREDLREKGLEGDEYVNRAK